MGITIRELYSIQHNALALAFKYLSHPGRLKIILLLLVNESFTLGQIQEHLGLSQSATSDQVRILKDAEIISGSVLGSSVLYSLNREGWQDLKELNNRFLSEVENLLIKC